jgi:acyl-CoA synthetase (AMP-forming)/AMP-acid ligase II
MTEPTIEDYFLEERTFPPSPEFKAGALTSDDSLYREADADYEAFWARQARELLSWNSDFDTTLEWELPFAKWFVGGTLNVSENCLDRHVANGIGDRVAYHWEGEPGDKRTITYSDLLEEVKKFANVLKGLGLEKGDRVAVYMPMIPELPVAMLACTRIGVAHSVIFGGFSPDSIIDRVHDGECKVIITADGGYRRGSASLLKPNVDEAVAGNVYGESVLLMVAGNTKVMVCGRPTEMLSMYIVAPELVPPDWSNVPFTNTNRYVEEVAGMVIREFCHPEITRPVSSTISVWVQVDVSNRYPKMAKLSRTYCAYQSKLITSPASALNTSLTTAGPWMTRYAEPPNSMLFINNTLFPATIGTPDAIVLVTLASVVHQVLVSNPRGLNESSSRQIANDGVNAVAAIAA